jgi:type IV secretory pathway VirJ component
MSTRAISLLLLALACTAPRVPAQNVTAVAPPSVADLPLVEIPPQGRSDRLAVFYSGDGGWASLDKGVSRRLAAAGVSVIGVNSLRYFWHERQPEQAAKDLTRVLEFYLRDRPERDKVLLVGYSTGADVLPFIVNRLPDALRARVASVTLIAPGHDAVFEIHVADWVPGRGRPGSPLAPEIERLGPPVLCVYGPGDRSTLCPELSSQRVTTAPIGEGHHLGGEYEEIASRILSFSTSQHTNP